MTKFKAAIFDMDGLLLDSEKICMDCFFESCDSIGYKADPNVYMRCIGSNAEATKNHLINGHREYFPYEKINRHWKTLYYNRVYHSPIPIKPGVHEVLEKLSSLGIPAGIATSTPQELALLKLQNAGLLTHFDFVVSGEQVSKSKPDPEIYLAAAKRHNIDVRQCLAFEDSENGVRSAYRAGITVIQVPDLVKPTEQLKSLGHKIIDSLHKVDFDD